VSAIQGSNENRRLGALAARIAGPAGIGGVILLVVAVLITWRSEIAWERFLRSYLVAFCFVLSLSLGGLFFTMLQHLTRAGWSVVLRRIAEGLAGNLRWIWILFIPIVIGLFTTDLYHWTHAGEDLLLAHKRPFLNPTFWVIRVVIYFAVWAGLAHFFLRASVAQDASGDPKLTLRMQRIAAPGMILYAFTQTFAIIDWVMALEPHWFSTMFGVYFFAASCCGFGATMVILCFALQRSGRVTESITTEHYQDLGKYLFAFGVVFWAYIAYSQYVLIWYANIPEETAWFLVRQSFRRAVPDPDLTAPETLEGLPGRGGGMDAVRSFHRHLLADHARDPRGAGRVREHLPAARGRLRGVVRRDLRPALERARRVVRAGHGGHRHRRSGGRTAPGVADPRR
jgi:hypothetical protein